MPSGISPFTCVLNSMLGDLWTIVSTCHFTVCEKNKTKQETNKKKTKKPKNPKKQNRTKNKQKTPHHTAFYKPRGKCLLELWVF